MTNVEAGRSSEQEPEINAAMLFARFESIGLKLEEFRRENPGYKAHGAKEIDDQDFDEKFTLPEGEKITLEWVAYPTFLRTSDKEANVLIGSLSYEEPDDEGPTYYFFGRKVPLSLGEISIMPTIYTYQYEAGEAIEIDYTEDPTVLKRLKNVIDVIEDTVNFRLNNPIESIPTLSGDS